MVIIRKKININHARDIFISLIILSLFFFGLFLSDITLAGREGSCPVLTPRIGCKGPWPIKIKNKDKDPKSDTKKALEENKRKAADAINNYIKINAWGSSRFFEIRNGDPGMAILEIGLQEKINPVFLAAMAGAETHYATVGPSMDCGNPFGQPPTANNPVCTAKDGSKWYEYNKEHRFNEEMLRDQAKRIWYTYVNNPKIRTLEDFLNEYTPLAQNPYRDTPQSSCAKEMGVRCGAKERYLNALETIPRDAKGSIICSETGTGGGDLANADALTEKGIQCVLDATGHGQNLAPYTKQIYDSAHQFSINPLFTLAIANKDSTLGTEGAGKKYKNPGNISYRDDLYVESGVTAQAGVYGDGRWAVFSTYGDGFQAKTWLLRAFYIDLGYDTIEKIINRYAPPSENNTEEYIQQVKDFMEKYGGMCANQ